MKTTWALWFLLGVSGVSLAADAVDYGDPSAWLCRPEHPNACSADQTTTIVAASGGLSTEAFQPDPAAPIDCFYVYPTVSLDETPNSDMIAGPEEHSVISGQFARFGAVCRTYAPLYRQITLTALRAGRAGQPMAADRAMAYGDVLAAWNHYLAHDNAGRPFVLIGHSQGAGLLTRLVADEIDGKPIQARMVSALILGSSGVANPPGAEVGGTFQQVPPCRSVGQTGCVVQYAAFRSTVPPPEDSLFGRPRQGSGESVCTNPVNLEGGSGELHAYLRNGPDTSWVTPAAPIETPFVSVPGLLTAECVNERGFNYLKVTVHGDPSDPRTDDIGGDVMVNGVAVAQWGLHLIDVHLAMGNLVELVRAQSAAFSRQPAPPAGLRVGGE